MADNNKKTYIQTHNDEVKESTRQKIESLIEAKNDSSVREALKKENSPATPEDLSHLHNTNSIGTSGGDQRATEDELKADE